MFLSKLWFFLVAVAAGVALVFALVMPRPAERQAASQTSDKLVIGCDVVRIQLADFERKRLGNVGTFAHDDRVIATVQGASTAATLDQDRMQKARKLGEDTVMAAKLDPPSFAMFVDAHGRVVSRVGLDPDDYGDVVAGRPLVDQALAGYLVDDLWVVGKGQLVFVVASPIITRTDFQYVGALVVGYNATKDFAQKLVIPGRDPAEETEVGFFLGADAIATSKTVALDTAPLAEAIKSLPAGDRATDCTKSPQIAERNGSDSYEVVTARLPGEAGEHGAYYAVFTAAPETGGFSGTVHKVDKGDLSFGSFPWLIVAGGFVIALGVGFALMVVEVDRPLRRLVADTVRLAKGETERLDETKHGGKLGSIARSVNIHIDKLGREAKSAKKDLDQLLGPAPEGSLGTIDLLAMSPPAARSAAPPPSEFQFGGAPAPLPAAMPPPLAPPPRAASPPPLRPATPPPRPPTPLPVAPPMPMPVAPAPPAMGPPGQANFAASAPPMRLDEDILGSSGGYGSQPVSAGVVAPTHGGDSEATVVGGAAMPDIDPYFKQVYDQFLAVKRSCNEPTTGLTFQKFSDKLIKNRDDLIAKTGCREVRFTVYVKDGKAALKATPVRDEG